MAALSWRIAREGVVPARLDPSRFSIDVGEETLNLTRARRRFALLWALATSPPRTREDLFLRVWARPFFDDDDATALHTSVSRTRSVLPEGLDLVALPGGAYALEPSWQAAVPTLAPIAGLPLAPLGRDAEAARARTLLSVDGVALLHGPPGSGTSHLARALAEAWPTGSVVVDVRGATSGSARVAEVLDVHPARLHRALDDRLLVLDHADGVPDLPLDHRPTLVVGASVRTGLPAVALGPLATRDAASLARSLHLPAPDGPELPARIRVADGAVDRLTPSARQLLARLLAHPVGVLTGLARRLAGPDPVQALADLHALQQACLVQREGERLIALDALRLELQPEAASDVVDAWEAERHPTLPDDLRTRLEVAEGDLDLTHANLLARELEVEARGLLLPELRARLVLAEVSARSGLPDRSLLAELETALEDRSGVLRARLDLLRGMDARWRGEHAVAQPLLAAAARRARHGDHVTVERAAWLALAELQLGLAQHAEAERCLTEARDTAPDDDGHGRALTAAIHLDRGEVGSAAAVLAEAPPDRPWVALRRAQLALVTDPSAAPALAEVARRGFAAFDRRWVPAALVLGALASPDDTPRLLDLAQRALPPGDTASAALVTLARGWHDRRLSEVTGALGPVPWDLARFLCAAIPPRR